MLSSTVQSRLNLGFAYFVFGFIGSEARIRTRVPLFPFRPSTFFDSTVQGGGSPQNMFKIPSNRVARYEGKIISTNL
ncbi:hypothetical protein LY78DRAFT_652302 [Colletotrichum sublineola]|nr:hypothetical protein LY78DRAFT_652302 [Colletotrichum sublineola]